MTLLRKYQIAVFLVTDTPYVIQFFFSLDGISQLNDRFFALPYDDRVNI
ncbi:hypothetical protein BMS3Abin01_01416 [bacterium BMS3Abin01]|nr:hypothetical protein BMS3Abin01_01416 [bacterium BMS3Abin01]